MLPNRDRLTAFISVLVVVMTLLLHSCSDDDSYTLPSLQTEFVKAHTDAQGVVRSITTDGGLTYAIEQNVHTDVPDTIFRCVCSYEVEEHGHSATVYSLSHIYSQPPVPHSELEARPADPVNVRSMWKSGGYINMLLGVLTTGMGKHSYVFSEDSIATSKAGTKTLCVSLLHGRPAGDMESYTQDVYMSMPLESYASKCDSISVSVQTYQGVKTFVFENN